MEHGIEHSPNGSGHEEREVSVRTIVLSLAALLFGTFLVCLLVIGIFRYFHSANRVEESAKENQQQIPPEPRVEEKPYEQLVTVRAREDHVLTSYAWVDKKEGTVRIPIDRAIDQLAKKGLPSHDYLHDILTGTKPPMPAKPAAPKPQGSKNAKP